MPSIRRSPVGAWTRLGLGLVVLWLIVFRAGPWLQGYAPIAEIHAAAEAQGIDATALFYTDSEAFDDLRPLP